MTTNDYQTAVAAYADELRSLFAPEPAESRSAELHAASADTLADRADRLADRSAELLDQTTLFLSDKDPNVRLGAEQSLLAQAVASLRVAEGLMAAEAVEDDVETRSAAAPPEPAGFDDLLSLLETPLDSLGGDAAAEPAQTRGAAPQASRDDLIRTAGDAIDQVLDGVGAFGKDAIAGLLGLDTVLLKQAAQLISGELAELVAKLGEQASLLVSKAVRFLLQAYDSLLAALGQDAASALRQQVAGWLEQIQQGDSMAQLIGAALQADAVRAQGQFQRPHQAGGTDPGRHRRVEADSRYPAAHGRGGHGRRVHRPAGLRGLHRQRLRGCPSAGAHRPRDWRVAGGGGGSGVSLRVGIFGESQTRRLAPGLL